MRFQTYMYTESNYLQLMFEGMDRAEAEMLNTTAMIEQLVNQTGLDKNYSQWSSINLVEEFRREFLRDNQQDYYTIGNIVFTYNPF